MTQLTPRSFGSTLIAAGLVTFGIVGALHSPPASAEAASTPDRAEHLYQACIEGAPTTPDSHEQWSLRCLARIAVEEAHRACLQGAPTTPDSYEQWSRRCLTRVVAEADGAD